MIALAFLEMAPYLRGYAFYAGNHMQAVDEIIHLKKNKQPKKLGLFRSYPLNFKGYVYEE